MSTQSSGEGFAEIFMKGAVFTAGAAAAGLVLRKVFRREPEVVVVALASDDLEPSEHQQAGDAEVTL